MAAGLLALIVALVHLRVTASYVVYILLGLAFGAAVFQSGVHTTIAGVLLGLSVPASPYFHRDDFSNSVWQVVQQFEATHDDLQQAVTVHRPN